MMLPGGTGHFDNSGCQEVLDFSCYLHDGHRLALNQSQEVAPKPQGLRLGHLQQSVPAIFVESRGQTAQQQKQLTQIYLS